MTWTRLALAALTLTLAAPSHALFDPGNVGLPTSPGTLDPGDPPPVPPVPPTPPPIAIVEVGLDSISLVVRPPAGRTSQLLKQPPSGAFAPFQSPTPGVETTVRDERLHPGKGYCYRLEISGGGLPDESHTRCATTDWRVGFEGLTITEAESSRVLRLFDWRDTQAIAEGSDAAPALYHMNLLIEGGDPLAQQGFRSMGMHVQAQPIFPEELEGWNDAQAVARTCDTGPVVATMAARSAGPAVGDRFGGSCIPAGRWFFAVVPGHIYNEIRARMLEQIDRGDAPGVRALVFRRVPVQAALAVGVSRHVLSYTYLGEQGFEFNAIQQCFVDHGVRVCQISQELLGWVVRKVVHWVAEIGEAVVEGVRSAIGAITRLVKGEVTLDLQFRLLNTDPAFGTDQVMRSGWSGEELRLAHVKVEVRQGLAAFYGDTDSNGHVRLTVAKNSDTRVCVHVENDTAEVTEYLLEKTVCLKKLGKLAGDRSETIDARHDYLNALAAMSDAREYMRVVGGFEMPKITVLVGDQADQLAVSGRSFTPCMGRAPSLLGLSTELLGLLGPLWLAAGAANEFLFSVDMVLRPGDDGSRGVPVHEYGHAVMCEMLMHQGLDAFEIAWTDVIIATANQAPDSQATYLNEAFADFVTAQVLGGTNYFATQGAVSSENIQYCPAGGGCLEDNFDGTATFADQVHRVASILEDAFDGQAGTDVPNDASHWQVSGGGPFVAQNANDSDRGDEVVALAGSDLRTLFAYWDERGTLLREDNLLGGLADLMKARGYGDGEVCNLFALHDVTASCPGYVARRPWLDWMETGGKVFAAFAAAPAPGATPSAGSGVASAARPAALIAALAPASATRPAPGGDPAGEPVPCPECAPAVVLEGVQRIHVPKRGTQVRDTAFAFRLGEGAFEGIDPLGQLYRGGWDVRNGRGSKLRLHLGPDAEEALARLLVGSADDLGVAAGSLHPVGPARIELRLAKGESVVGKIVVPFEVEIDGRVKRGTYVAKLRGAGA